MVLYGRAAVFEDIVPSLVGLDPERGGWRRSPAGTPLLIECAGGRLTGKTALLKELEGQYAERLPQAYVDLDKKDFGHSGLASPPDETVPNASRVSDLLFLLLYELRQKPKKFGSGLTFPWLTQGLLAVTNWQAAGPAGLEASMRNLVELLKTSQPDVDARRARVLRAVERLSPAARELVPAAGELVSELIGLVAEEVLGPRANRDGLLWWKARRVRPQGDGYAQLTTLAMRFRSTPGRSENADGRRFAEKHLVAALLEDIADHYTWFRRRNLLPRPLLLLDNAHCELGVRFMDLLTETWFDTSPRTRPGVVVTTLAPEPAFPEPGGTAPSTRVVSASCHRQGPVGEPADWVLRVSMAQLWRDEVWELPGAEMLTADLSRVLHRFSAGRVGIAKALVRAARQKLDAHRSVRYEQLLDLEAADGSGRPVYEHLLRVLVSEEAADRALLAHLSPALDIDAATALQATAPDSSVRGNRSADVRRLLAHAGPARAVQPGAGGSFIADRPLRALLLHDLRVRASTATGAAGWLAPHHDARDCYPTGPDGRVDDRALHHALACGETDTVVAALHERLADEDAPAWLASLNLICAAPGPPANLPAPTPVPCPACSAGEDSVHQAVELLLLGLWAQSQPLAPPAPTAIAEIGRQLSILATTGTPAAQRVFGEAHIVWPPLLLNNWTQAPDLPTWGNNH
ncbi:hypothetical protein [Streptomyces kebangsaanensis]|uniref:hypothetical protein n=1 Tax=Streptomyces kebangsaanensis TaxID=864058 RepID=UPI00093905D0|nr:hypothetical protein [Streptomyces kebangsaanensis]